MLRSSPRIGNLALLIIGYGVCHRMFEFAWKGQLRILHPTPQAYQSVLSNVSIATGILSTILMLGGQYVFKYAGWGFAAAATPLILLVTGVIFFGFSLTASYGFAPFGMSTAAVAAAGVFVGAVTQVMLAEGDLVKATHFLPKYITPFNTESPQHVLHAVLRRAV